MRVAVVDYGSGNLQSVMQSLRGAGLVAGLSHEFLLTNKPDDVLASDYIVLPGVGAFADCAHNLRMIDGMVEALESKVIADGAPFLGICVGMQLLADFGHEDGLTKGLGWVGGDVKKMTMPSINDRLKIPHMGWNGLITKTPHTVMAGIDADDAVYFVHGYHFMAKNNDHIIAEVAYGNTMVAAVGRDNIIGTQFHPEKSQAIGQIFLTNWLNWKP